MKEIKWERRETEWDKVNTSLDSGIHPSAPRKHTKLIRCTEMLQSLHCYHRDHCAGAGFTM